MPTKITTFESLLSEMPKREYLNIWSIPQLTEYDVKLAEQWVRNKDPALRVIVKSKSKTSLVGFIGYKDIRDNEWHIITEPIAYDYNRIDFFRPFLEKRESLYFYLSGSGVWKMDDLEFISFKQYENVARARFLYYQISERIEPPITKTSREKVFFSGQYFDASQNVMEIFKQATTKICIVDGYLGLKVLQMLIVKKASVSVDVLTKSIPTDLKIAAEDFNKQYRGLSIRISNAFHDRFIIIDNRDFYHLGASIKDFGKSGFMFSRIEEPEVIKKIQEQLSQEWSTASKEI